MINKPLGLIATGELENIKEKEIREFLIKKRNIVYGARSIHAQSELSPRYTNDWDIFSNNPKKDANYLKNKLNKRVGTKFFYVHEAKHKGTFKVRTMDNEEVADFTKQEEDIKSVIINKIRYRNLKEEMKRKKMSISDKNYKFRHEKDRNDLELIKAQMDYKRLLD